MSTITTLVGTDGITTGNSMTKINTNFSNLNTDKIETSTLDTDTTLAANSDSKIPTQKAVKAYVDAGGNVNASETARGIVEEATDAEVSAGTATGATGAKLFVTPAKLTTYISSTGTLPTIQNFDAISIDGDQSTRFDITNPSGTTFRYTYDGTGTNPGITSTTVPTGVTVIIQGADFSAGNKGTFTVTSSGTDYFEITNASGVVESNKTIGNGYIIRSQTWTKPAGLKYAIIEVQAPGGGTGSVTTASLAGGGAGGGGYSKKKVAAASLGSTESLFVGVGGKYGSGFSGGTGPSSSFGSHCSATGGTGTGVNVSIGSSPGVGSNGDLNLYGQYGESTPGTQPSGRGGDSFWGRGGNGRSSDGVGDNGLLYGGGAAGSMRASSNQNGATGANGRIVVTEYYV